jgi:hypothetical protein
VVCLDVLRVLQGEPDSLKEAMRELKMCFGIDPRFDGCVHTYNRGAFMTELWDVLQICNSKRPSVLLTSLCCEPPHEISLLVLTDGGTHPFSRTLTWQVVHTAAGRASGGAGGGEPLPLRDARTATGRPHGTRAAGIVSALVPSNKLLHAFIVGALVDAVLTNFNLNAVSVLRGRRRC